MRRALVLRRRPRGRARSVAVGASGAATPRVQIAQVDTSRYPLITAVVIAPGSDKLRQRAAHAAARTARPSPTTQSGGGAPAAIGVAIDVSRSMEGAPLRRRASRPPPRS